MVDATGIKGRYELKIQGPNLDALLPPGLKLEARKVKPQVLVVDHVDEQSTAN